MAENSINFVSQQSLSSHRYFLTKLALQTRLSIIFLLVVVFGGLITYGLKTFFESRTEAVMTEIQGLSVKRSTATENSMLQLPDQVRSIKELFKKHFYATNIFKFFRENTLKQVRIVNAKFERESRQLTFSAQASTFETLAAQLLVLRSKSEVKDASISGIKLLETGRVAFQITLTLAESIITTP